MDIHSNKKEKVYPAKCSICASDENTYCYKRGFINGLSLGLRIGAIIIMILAFCIPFFAN